MAQTNQQQQPVSFNTAAIPNLNQMRQRAAQQQQHQILGNSQVI